MWRNNVLCEVFASSSNHIDITMLKNNVPYWRLTCFYGYPERSRRRDSRDFIRQLASVSQLPWCIIGDFNDLLYPSDKEGSVDHPSFSDERF